MMKKYLRYKIKLKTLLGIVSALQVAKFVSEEQHKTYTIEKGVVVPSIHE